MTNSYLLDKLNYSKKKLRKICPSLFSKVNKSGKSVLDYDYTGEGKEDKLLNFQKKYYKKVEQGNRYINQLKNIEKAYFEEKYGAQVYNYIKKQRNKYIKKKSRNRSTASCADGSSNEKFCDIYDKMKKQYEIYSVINSDDSNKKIKIVKQNLNMMDEELSEMNNKTELDKRKIKYRNSIIYKTTIYSNYVTILYYIILICVFVFLYVNELLNFKQNRNFYITLIILPLLYKYIFSLLVYLYNLIRKYTIKNGPKNAFLNENSKLNFLDD